MCPSTVQVANCGLGQRLSCEARRGERNEVPTANTHLERGHGRTHGDCDGRRRGAQDGTLGGSSLDGRGFLCVG